MPFGTKRDGDGVRFSLWAPSADAVTLVCDGGELPMPHVGQGWYRIVVPQAKPGSRYSFRVGADVNVPDPASRRQTAATKGESIVVDPERFAWTDGAWTGRAWEEAVLYEAHVGTATAAGTFAGLADRLEALAELGITAIELMPLADCPGARNWGYDGVLLFAPNEAYGSPDDLKRLVDQAHALGLMIFIDVVYNHFGPDGNFLSLYAGSFFTERHQTPWGAGLNYDGADGEVVREFFIHNALYWLEEFHVDGLRFDAVHAIADDGTPHILTEIAERVRAALPDRHVHLVLENEKNEARWLARSGGQPLLYDAQWNDDIHHCWHRLLTGEAEGYYADFGGDTIARLGRCLAEGFAYQGETSAHMGRPRGEPSGDLPPQAFVAFLQNHDQIGNRAFGERLTLLAPAERLRLARALLLLSPQIPMLFMGEEWGATTPFQYFVDFADDPALSQAIRDGRRREFAGFGAFADTARAASIPDPTAASTFAASKLAWDERGHAPHDAILAETRQLLELRRSVVVPLVKSGFKEAASRRVEAGGLETTWHFVAGTLTATANFAAAPLRLPAAVGSVIWQSEGVGAEGDLVLPSWTGRITRSAP